MNLKPPGSLCMSYYGLFSELWFNLRRSCWYVGVRFLRCATLTADAMPEEDHHKAPFTLQRAQTHNPHSASVCLVHADTSRMFAQHIYDKYSFISVNLNIRRLILFSKSVNKLPAQTPEGIKRSYCG